MTSKDIVGGLVPGEKQRYIQVASGVWAELIAIATGIMAASDDSLSVIDHAHRKLHEGKLFTVDTRAEHGSELANDSALNLLIATGDKETHILWAVAAGGDAELYVYESPTTAGGSPIIPTNHRIGGDASGVTITEGVTGATSGTELGYWFFPGGSGPQASGVDMRGHNEFDVPPNTAISFVLYNRAGSSQIMRLGASWYEEG